MPRRFAVLDVFTTKRFAGNPLAVVLDSEGLDDIGMQMIAREFGLSETVFVLPPSRAGSRAALRIFTPGLELPFAGHPTVGTAVLLGLKDAAEGRGEARIVIEEKVGAIDCAVEVRDEAAGHATFRLPRLPASVGNAASTVMLAGALGLGKREIGFEGHMPSVYSAGVGFTLVPVANRDALSRIRLDTGLWSQAIRSPDHPNAFVYCREPERQGHHFRARMFAPGMGISEDPATGAAAAALAGAVMQFEAPADGTHRYVVEQGYEMGRPSLIELGLDVVGGSLASASIGGGAVMVSEGVLL